MPGPAFLRGERVELRTFEETDIGLIAPVFGDPERRQRMGPHGPYTRRGERAWFESLDEDDIGLVLCPREGGDVTGAERTGEPTGAGVLMLYDIDAAAGTAEFGLTLVPEFHGQGYATAGSRLLLEYAFDERRLHRVRAMTLSVNDPAQRLLDRLGFTHEGTAREAAIYQGERVDELQYGLLASEWRGGRGTAEG